MITGRARQLQRLIAASWVFSKCGAWPYPRSRRAGRGSRALVGRGRPATKEMARRWIRRLNNLFGCRAASCVLVTGGLDRVEQSLWCGELFGLVIDHSARVVILLHPLLHLVGVSIETQRGRKQNNLVTVLDQDVPTGCVQQRCPPRQVVELRAGKSSRVDQCGAIGNTVLERVGPPRPEWHFKQHLRAGVELQPVESKLPDRGRTLLPEKDPRCAY